MVCSAEHHVAGVEQDAEHAVDEQWSRDPVKQRSPHHAGLRAAGLALTRLSFCHTPLHTCTFSRCSNRDKRWERHREMTASPAVVLKVVASVGHTHAALESARLG